MNEKFDWNDAMRIVHKIESAGHPVWINSNNCTIYEKVGKNHGWMIDVYGTTKEDAVLKAISDYWKIN
jgi:hypothetical protein